MKGWVCLVGWPIADGLPTLVVTHQLQVERRTGKVRRPETDVLPLCHVTNPPVQAPRRNALLMQFLISALYILFAYLYHMLPHFSFFHFFLTYLLPYSSFPLRTDPLWFQARCHKRRLNLALVFLYSFCVIVHFFWLANACFCCVRFSFFHTKPRDCLGETSPKWPILCRARRKTTTPTVSVVGWVTGHHFYKHLNTHAIYHL